MATRCPEGRQTFRAWMLGAAMAAALMVGAGSKSALADLPTMNAAGSLNQLVSGASPEQVGIVPHPDAQVPLDPIFSDEYSQPTQLSAFVTGHRPVILVPVYYSCPKLCNLTLNGLFAALKDPKMDLQVGRDYEVVALSFDDHDTAEVAKAKKENYLRKFGEDNADAHVHFLTGHEGQIRQVTNAIGFGYMWNDTDKLYAHQTGIFILKPDGKVSRTIGGSEFDPQELRDSLLNAGQGKIGSSLFQVALSCGMISFDGENGKYRKNAIRLMQVGAFGSMVFVGGILAVMWRREARRSLLPKNVSQKSPSLNQNSENQNT